MKMRFNHKVTQEFLWLIQRIREEDSLTTEKHYNPAIAHYSQNPPKDFFGKEVWHGININFLTYLNHPPLDRISKIINILQEEGALTILRTRDDGWFHFELNEMVLDDFEKQLSDAGHVIQKNMRVEIYFSVDPCALYCKTSGAKLPFDKDDEKQTILIRRALREKDETDQWLCCDDHDLEGTFNRRKLYDCARAINKKFRSTFGLLEGLFETDLSNGRVKICVSGKNFLVIQS